MSEEQMVQLAQAALDRDGVRDTVVAVGQFTPRGQSGARMAGDERAAREPDEILFTVPREGVEAKFHRRVNVRVLELVNEGTGQSIQLEGNRLPVTHPKDVMDVLTGRG